MILESYAESDSNKFMTGNTPHQLVQYSTTGFLLEPGRRDLYYFTFAISICVPATSHEAV